MAARYNSRGESSGQGKSKPLGARDPMTARRIKLAMLLALVLLLIAALPRKAPAQAISSMNPEFLEQSADWPPAAEQLARKIVAITGAVPVSLQIENSSSISAEEFAEVQRLIVGRLRSAGAAPSAPAGAAYSARIVVSQNARAFVLAAVVNQSSGEPAAAIATAAPSAPQAAANAVTLARTFLLRQDAPILDAQFLTPATLVVLGADRITAYGRTPNGWQSIASAEIAAHHAMPRDLRGRLAVRADSFDAYLPGMVCSSASLAPLAIGCRDSDDPWPISLQSALYNSARNYFARGNGDFSEFLVKFYSAAFFWQSRTEPHVVFTTSEGVMRDGPSGALPVDAPGWGSEVALLYNASAAAGGCNGSHILATMAGDYTERDAVRAFEIHGQRAVAASDPVEFAGPVLALWSSPDMTAATVVSQNSKTGSYEAYRVTASCLL